MSRQFSIPLTTSSPKHNKSARARKHHEVPYSKPVNAPKHQKIPYSKPLVHQEVHYSKPVKAPQHHETPYSKPVYAPQHHEVPYINDIYGTQPIPGIVTFIKIEIELLILAQTAKPTQNTHHHTDNSVPAPIVNGRNFGYEYFGNQNHNTVRFGPFGFYANFYS